MEKGCPGAGQCCDIGEGCPTVTLGGRHIPRQRGGGSGNVPMVSQSGVGWKGPYRAFEGHLPLNAHPWDHTEGLRAMAAPGWQRAPGMGLCHPPQCHHPQVTPLRLMPPPHLDPKPAPGGASPHGPVPCWFKRGHNHPPSSALIPVPQASCEWKTPPASRGAPGRAAGHFAPPRSHRADPPGHTTMAA